jgi:hypothetical protein
MQTRKMTTAWSSCRQTPGLRENGNAVELGTILSSDGDPEDKAELMVEAVDNMVAAVAIL